jgi:DNA-binding GntR family transcriptional regulator
MNSLDALSVPSHDLRLEHGDLTRRTYSTLRHLIVTRVIPAGGKVTADGLSQRLGVSRTTVKGAIDQLEAEGLVEVRPQVGTFVRGLTTEDIRALWDARLMLEVFAARRGVLDATDSQRRELQEIVSQMAPLIERDDYREDTYEAGTALNRRFHELILETAQNKYILSMHQQIRSQVHIVDFHSRRGIRRADLGLAEHRTIALAYEQRDPELAVATVTMHVERSRDATLLATARFDRV